MQHNQKIATVTLNPAIDQTVVIPDFQAGKVNRVAHSRLDPGGKGINVASFLADFGHPVTATGFLGRENPELFEQLFADRAIQDRFWRIGGSTRIGIKIVDDLRAQTTDINFPGLTPSAGDLHALFAIVEELTAVCEWFVLSGSIPAGVAPDIYARLVCLIRAKGRAVALDTSGEALRLALPQAPNLVKPNIHELQELFGAPLASRSAVVEGARQLLEQGVQSVVVSMGEEGALFLEPQQRLLACPLEVSVQSTVGAGDAMVSGTVAGKLRGGSLADCARLATAFSASAISRVGAGLPSLPTVEALMNQVTIKDLNGLP